MTSAFVGKVDLARMIGSFPREHAEGDLPDTTT